VALSDSQVDGPCGSGNQRDGGWLGALADDPQRSMTSLESEILDVRRARFADPQSVEAD
jgi:hypothetical protein